MRILPGLGASFAILTLGLIPIWLPAPDLLIDEGAVTTCFALQVQTAGVNNKFPSVSCKAGSWKTASLRASLSRLRSQAYLRSVLATNRYDKRQSLLNASRVADSAVVDIGSDCLPGCRNDRSHGLSARL